MSDPRSRGVGPVEARLVEELAEVIQVVCKAQRWGWGGVNPDDGKDKRARVVEEMRDVVDAWNELAEIEGLPYIAIDGHGICKTCGSECGVCGGELAESHQHGEGA